MRKRPCNPLEIATSGTVGQMLDEKCPMISTQCHLVLVVLLFYIYIYINIYTYGISYAGELENVVDGDAHVDKSKKAINTGHLRCTYSGRVSGIVRPGGAT